MKIRAFPNPVVVQQSSSDQPRIWVWFLLLFVPNWLPNLLAKGLMQWPSFAQILAHHHKSYFVAFYAVQMSLTCGAILFLSRSYASALWSPPPPPQSQSSNSLVILVPLLLYHLSSWLSILPIMALPSNATSQELSQMLAAAHNDVWGPLAYGASLSGVVCGSILSFISPVLEEMLFSGLLANRLLKSFGAAVAVLGTPVCFALIHGVQFGLGTQLIPLFFAGLTYTIIRLHSGSLRMAVFSHLAINFVIFVPKWAIAAMHFRHP